ncbi:V-type ATP synthase subunit F [Ructibacterium gallinarum]|uniref:V-type ATP synthase subunit F n=1 Tax=Ructibacterium gallinarum TaxID=2779355 RepID=A0A9D5LZG1_9FIRM|nr:V-type ATP synthase subunit F [Ructibacterium gallinarum]MBE5039435.1 V-type ATP synthase subunit F [Ructibacterium gallinarum]
MKYYLLSDNIDTQIGMRLAGVEGIVVHEPDEFKQAFDQALADKDIAILLITEKLVNLCPEYVAQQKTNNKIPLIVELPDRHGSKRPDDYILNYVRDAIGVRL